MEDAGGASVSSAERGGGPQLGSGCLGLVWILFPEPWIQAHMGAVLWEVLIQPVFLPPENLKILLRLLLRSAEIIQPSPLVSVSQEFLLVHTTRVQPPDSSCWVCFLLLILLPTFHSSRLLVLITAVNRPRRRRTKQRVLIFTLSSVCPE